ncbi:MAG TPA: FAD-binding oxidoreductase [Bryobacteraceae bacterium]|nr:FAD-binding oxidoreductase [Bryobacteraceae bacterium]
MPREPIVVVGAGIIGASIAYHLAKRGAQVTIVEASRPASEASGKSFGWINATFSKRPRHYFDLNIHAVADWHRLHEELNGEPAIQWGGSVTWCVPGADAADLAQGIRNHRQWGYAVREIDAAELHRLLPNVAPGDFQKACFCESEGAVDPVEAVNVLLNFAQRSSAEIRCPSTVTGLEIANGQVRGVRTEAGSIRAGTLVLACGVAIPGIAQMASLQVPLKDAPGVLVHTAQLPKLIDRVAIAPGVHFKQTADGRIVVGGQIVAGAGTSVSDANINQASEIFEQARRFLPALHDARIDHVTLGHRVMPEDEYPILGFSAPCPNLYLAATHSGVTLAPLIGRLAAIEILDGTPVSLLEPYRPSRFS